MIKPVKTGYMMLATPCRTYRVSPECHINDSSEWILDGIAPIRSVRRVYGAQWLFYLCDLSDKEQQGLLRYKNGNPRFRVIDIDHGTRRIWGEGITSVWWQYGYKEDK